MLPLTKCSRVIDLILEQGFKTSNPELLALLDEYQERGEVDTKPKDFIIKRLRKAADFTSLESWLKETILLSLQIHRRDSMIIVGMSKQYVECNTNLAYAMNAAIDGQMSIINATCGSSSAGVTWQDVHDQLFGSN